MNILTKPRTRPTKQFIINASKSMCKNSVANTDVHYKYAECRHINTSKVTVTGSSVCVACGEPTRTVVPHIRCFCVYVAPPCEWKNWQFVVYFFLQNLAK